MTHFHRRRGIHRDSPPPLFIPDTSHSHSTSLHSHCQRIHNIGYFLTKLLVFQNIFCIFCSTLFHFFEINGIICTLNKSVSQSFRTILLNSHVKHDHDRRFLLWIYLKLSDKQKTLY